MTNIAPAPGTSQVPPERPPAVEQQPADFDARAALAALDGVGTGQLLHVHEIPARPAQEAGWPGWVNPQVAAAVNGTGIDRLWSHQRRAADLAWSGEHVVLSTGTASGKSLGYLLPMLSAVADGTAAPTGRGATAIYLAPTKALAADQEARIRGFAIPGVRAATLDGDTPLDERRWIRDHAALVLTNPDLLHHTLLPGHERWASFLRALKYVVIDECHVYKGVFGSHVAGVIRRLRRLAARYRAEPTFVLASATVATPGLHASELIGLPVREVTVDGSPRAPMVVGLWQPGGKPGSGHETARRSAVAESADLMAGLIGRGVQTLTFARSRVGVEVVAEMVRASAGDHVAAYRGGYLPEERRALENDLRTGKLRGLAATSALELGIDVSGLDAVLLAGWPGTLASLWQRAGRAGRSRRTSLVVLVADDDPLDSFLVHHPDAVFERPVEAATLDPGNPFVLAPHVAAAAHELPVTTADTELFGPSLPGILDSLVSGGVLRKRPRGWFWARDDRPADHFSLRGGGEDDVRIVETRTARVLGTVDAARAHAAVHTGAVYLHQGQSYVVTELDLEATTAQVVVGDPGWSTVAQSVSAFDIKHSERETRWGDAVLHFGTIKVRTRVTSFQRLLPSGEVIGIHQLDLPERELVTRGVWWTIDEDELLAAGLAPGELPGALHAAEHASIAMLPLVAQSDRWDVGGVSTALHPDTGLPTVVVYDGYPGGAGFAERAYGEAATWLMATRAAIAGCPCSDGCPACVQSPKCGNGNNPLDKRGAVVVLDRLLRDHHTG
ncbi:DEAD/DEAH box helicase [Flexivirga oryzae]|uniref:DEAD/DEAH box helicase domain-containing protein n=1 Tax=Flexivirga oryzae TaxID=1794944 RepID=A0A839NA12_9MICO|nr:DEAD/DEAH box helicase [Flexivirga oryzae]MBB2893033.1 DEAD/DEAH box helicase domain-containing protein [Flexivirga oryzae]